MPGVKPPLAPPPNPFTAEERERFAARARDLLAGVTPGDVNVDPERVERVVATLLHRPMVTGAELTEARMLASRAADVAPDLASLLRRLADRRGTQVHDREPAWIMGNPASELYWE